MPSHLDDLEQLESEPCHLCTQGDAVACVRLKRCTALKPVTGLRIRWFWWKVSDAIGGRSWSDLIIGLSQLPPLHNDIHCIPPLERVCILDAAGPFPDYHILPSVPQCNLHPTYGIN